MSPSANLRARLSVESLEGRAVPAVGGLDPSFSGDGKATWSYLNGKYDEATAVVAQADGKVVTVGSAERSSPDDYDFFVTRHNRDGSLDLTFGNNNGYRLVAFDLGGTKLDRATCVTLDGQGRILVGGYARTAAGDDDFAVCRLTAAGTLDQTFSGDGKATVAFDKSGDENDYCRAIAWRDGRIVLGGSVDLATDVDFGVCRLLEDGTLDASLNGTGKATVAFDIGGSKNDYANAVAIDGGGRILLAGRVDRAADIDFGVCRLKFDGTLDATFSGDGKQAVAFDYGGTDDDICRAMALDKNGNIYLAGSSATASLGTDMAVCRLTTFGDLDTTFRNTGKQTIGFNDGGTSDDSADAVVIQPDGKVVLAGTAATAAGSRFGLYRMFPGNGATDISLNIPDAGRVRIDFDLGGTDDDICNGVAWTPDGLVVVGRADTAANGFDAALARIVESNRVLVSPDQGGPPTVKVFSTTGVYLGRIDAYGAAFTGGVSTAAGDVNGDGIDDIFCAPGVGGSPIVKVYDGATFALIKSIQVYGMSFTKGVNLAVGDVVGDAKVELVVAPEVGGAPYVNIFDAATGTLTKQVQAYGLAFTKGVRVAVGDTAGDAKKEILVAPEAGGAPTVNVFDAATATLIKQIQALDAAFTGGLYLAAGKGTSGKDDLYVGPGAGGASAVRRFDTQTGVLLQTYGLFAGGPAAGVRVGTVNANGDDLPDLLAAAGPGTAPEVVVRGESAQGTSFTFDPFDAAMTAGLFVSGARR